MRVISERRTSLILKRPAEVHEPGQVRESYAHAEARLPGHVPAVLAKDRGIADGEMKCHPYVLKVHSKRALRYSWVAELKITSKNCKQKFLSAATLFLKTALHFLFIGHDSGGMELRT